MPRLHYEIASDTYWQQPPAPNLHKLPLATNFRDGVFPLPKLGQIAQNYQGLESAQYGIDVLDKSLGETLEFVAPNGLLKVVSDMRTYPKKPIARKWMETPRVFDETAQNMINTILYDGPMVGTEFIAPDGRLVSVARRVLYFTYASSKKQLIGMQSDYVRGQGISELVATYQRFEEPLGSQYQFETSKETVSIRKIAAQVLRPQRRPRHRETITRPSGLGVDRRVLVNA